MNPCVGVSCSSEERGDRSSWVCGNSWDNAQAATAMSVGLENARPFNGRLDWDWENPTPATNPSLLLSQRFHHHHHEQSDSEDQKPQITTVAPPGLNMSFRQYGMGMGYSSHHPHHHQNALALLNSSGIRNFGDGIPSTSSFHPGLLYPDVSGFGAGAYDSRSHLFGMMSLQEQHQKESAAGGSIFHDIVKREDVCAGEFQTRIGLNLGHRTYFSSEDTAISRLYKRPRAIPSASQVPRCQAEGCSADLSNTKPYHRRHKVCEFHSKATSVVTGGVQQRFCQQCSRFHVLSEFDEVKRSCRKRLADHNRRRRKPQPNAGVPAASSSAETHTTAFKSEGENSIKSKPDANSNDTRGLQVGTVMRTESQGLMNAMALPLMLQNSKGQINPNPNANSNTSPSANPNRNTSVLQHNSHKVSSVPSQQQQYHAAQKGPNLSMGLCNQRQTAAASQDYSGLELALPWLRPSSNYSGGSSHHRSSNSPPMDILQPLMAEKADVEGFSSPIQNFLPLSGSNSRELGTTSQWMMGNNDNTEHQHIFSLLETPGVRSEENSNNQGPVEYLSHRRGLNTKDTVEGQSNSAKFSDMQSLRPFGQSMYDASL